MSEKKIPQSLPPDRRPLTTIQAERLAGLTQTDSKTLVGLSVAEISEKFKWQIDPELLLYRRICGRVVKKDPVTGNEYPVPFATVYVEDTDCNLLLFAPPSEPWAWFFPFLCHREVIATAVTDECGNFCVYVPRWEVDWILRWRWQRICYPDLFIRPSIRDLLERVFPIPEPFPDPPIRFDPPRPQPDPVPWLLQNASRVLSRVKGMVSPEVTEQLRMVEHLATFGANADDLRGLLDKPAFTQPVPPPLPADLMEGVEQREVAAKAYARLDAQGADVPQAATLQARLKAGHINWDHYIGPFWRCHNVLVPEWSAILDVPDITFRVTQDVDGDGDEEIIYSEGYFDVRWDSGPIPDVTLEASEIAIHSVSCGGPEVPCETPAIVMAGLMPVQDPPSPAPPYHNRTTGYALRPNRPHPSGSFATPLAAPEARTPFCNTVQLYGCNDYEGAQYYRLRYRFNGGAPVTFDHHTWKLVRWVGSPGHLEVLNVTPDSNGWYDILSPSDGWMPANLLLNWPTGGYQNGTYDIDMELGDGAKTVIQTTPSVAFKVDNTHPNVVFNSMAWREVGETTWHNLGFFCPVIRRNAGATIEIRLALQISAQHMRSMIVKGGGCGGAAPVLHSPLPANWELIYDPPLPNPAAKPVGMRHWHTSPADNSFSSLASPTVFRLDGSAPSGVYTFSVDAHSRAFNPSGGDAGFGADWFYDPVYKAAYPDVHVAIVDK